MSSQRTRRPAPQKTGGRSGGTKRQPTPPPPATSTTRTAVVAGAALLVGIGGTLGVNALVQEDEESDTAAQIEAADAARDVEVTAELTEIARQVAEDLGPAVGGLVAAVPSDEDPSAGPIASADDVATWRGAVDQALSSFGDPRSAGTAVNVARISLTSAVEQFQSTVSVYEAALDAEGEQQQRLVDIAGEQLDTAIYTWSLAATQIDLINVEADLGHAHVVLPSAPSTSTFLDGAPEGSH